MNYFITVDGIETMKNLTRPQAIREANRQYQQTPEKGTINIGIGRVFMVKGKYPPIPIRDYDWAAIREDYDEGDLIGTGRNEQDAIDDLLNQENERRLDQQ